MKEVLTKNFWREVKRTFYTALEGPPAEEKTSQATADTSPKDAPEPETAAPPPAPSKQG